MNNEQGSSHIYSTLPLKQNAYLFMSTHMHLSCNQSNMTSHCVLFFGAQFLPLLFSILPILISAQAPQILTWPTTL